MLSEQLIEALTEEKPVDKRKARFPTPYEVGYVPPMEPPFEGKGRQCGNCMMWVPKGPDRCSILGPQLEVTQRHVCSYHVPGAPMRGKWKDHPGGMQYLTATQAGLILGPQEGTSCGNCEYATDGARRCQVVQDAQGKLVSVFPGSCCNRWEPGV